MQPVSDVMMIHGDDKSLKDGFTIEIATGPGRWLVLRYDTAEEAKQARAIVMQGSPTLSHGAAA